MADSAPARPLLIGHRGAPAYRPEHTAAAYRLAIAQGCDAIEPDIVPTRDGVLIVRHDRDLARTTDIADRPEFASRRATKEVDGIEETGWFAEDFDWDELAVLRAREPLPQLRPGSAGHDGDQGILRLIDLVRLVDVAAPGTRPRLVIELKTPAWFATQGHDLPSLLVDELESIGSSPALDGLVIECFEDAALRELRWLGAPSALVLLIDDALGIAGETLPVTAELLDELASWADGVSVSHRLLAVEGDASAADPAAGRALVDAAHARELDVFTWTLRHEDQFLPAAFRGRPEAYWRGLLRTGVDGVFADAPDRVAPLLDELGPRQAGIRLPSPVRARGDVGGRA